MKPSAKYHEYLQQSGFDPDPAQQRVIGLLDQLHAELIEANQQKTLFAQILDRFNSAQASPRGLYVWGGVGRGKTFVMDIFFECLPFTAKKRYHFHHFMQQIHDELIELKRGKDPLDEIARRFAETTRVLCLDEFVVIDIGDAMLIGRLLEALFARGLVLVTTSNSAPQDLYKDGLQRARFLPAIDSLVDNCQVINLDGEQDYRLQGLQQAQLFHVPHDQTAVQSIREYLRSHLVSGHELGSLRIHGRDINYLYRAEDTVWLSFAELCETARSRFDYLEIAREFGTMVLSEIQPMDDRLSDVTRRFISLIDVLYDHRVKLICSSAVAIDELYQDQFLSFEFERTRSRLQEMQTQNYLAMPHLG
ncbi:MAG: cell division protein ZapE [Gammaproteobacteria bacterium]|nr:cell division protein ZapE [Gammaproteobacteria bacterium]